MGSCVVKKEVVVIKPTQSYQSSNNNIQPKKQMTTDDAIKHDSIKNIKAIEIKEMKEAEVRQNSADRLEKILESSELCKNSSKKDVTKVDKVSFLLLES